MGLLLNYKQNPCKITITCHLLHSSCSPQLMHHWRHTAFPVWLPPRFGVPYCLFCQIIMSHLVHCWGKILMDSSCGCLYGHNSAHKTEQMINHAFCYLKQYRWLQKKRDFHYNLNGARENKIEKSKCFTKTKSSFVIITFVCLPEKLICLIAYEKLFNCLTTRSLSRVAKLIKSLVLSKLHELIFSIKVGHPPPTICSHSFTVPQWMNEWTGDEVKSWET